MESVRPPPTCRFFREDSNKSGCLCSSVNKKNQQVDGRGRRGTKSEAFTCSPRLFLKGSLLCSSLPFLQEKGLASIVLDVLILHRCRAIVFVIVIPPCHSALDAPAFLFLFCGREARHGGGAHVPRKRVVAPSLLLRYKDEVFSKGRGALMRGERRKTKAAAAAPVCLSVCLLLSARLRR